MFFTNIITFLRGGIPFFTNLFSKELAINSIDNQGNISTIEDHLLKTGDYVVVKNVSYLWNIIDVDYNPVSGVLIGSLNDNHQIYKCDKLLTLGGDYEGEGLLIDLSLKNEIRLQLPKNLIINDIYVSKILNQRINSYHKVINIVDEKTFRINYIEEEPQILRNGQVITESRVDGGYNVEDYIDGYVKLDKRNLDFLYVEYDSNEVSRSESSETDFNQSMQKFSEQWITNKDNINIYYISNTTQEASKVMFVDRATRIVRNALLNVLQTNSELSEDSSYTLTYDGGGITNIKQGQTNFSLYRYTFYLQFTFTDNLLYNKYLIDRIKNIKITNNK